jgi:hypothetical protein
MGVSASSRLLSEGFSVPGRCSGFSFGRLVHGSGGRRPDETTDGAASIQLRQEGRWSQTALADSRNVCEIKNVADAYAEVSKVLVGSWAGLVSRQLTLREILLHRLVMLLLLFVYVHVAVRGLPRTVRNRRAATVT